MDYKTAKSTLDMLIKERVKVEKGFASFVKKLPASIKQRGMTVTYISSLLGYKSTASFYNRVKKNSFTEEELRIIVNELKLPERLEGIEFS